LTQLKDAKAGIISPEMKIVAKCENISENKLLSRIAEGKIVIPKNINRNTDACGIGYGLSTKVNANIGSSSKIENLESEVEKAKIAVKYVADAVMDLSKCSKLK
jgi:phosphomethylpyrimidine synthase